MKLPAWINRLLIDNYDAKVKSALITAKMIHRSTYPTLSHFYNEKGEKIRGFEDGRNIVKQHPLIEKYS